MAEARLTGPLLAALVALALGVVASETSGEAGGGRSLLAADEVVADKGKAVYVAKTSSDVQAGVSSIARGHAEFVFPDRALLGEAGADETRGFVAASKTRSLRLRYPYKTADGTAVGKKSDPRKARLVSTSERSFSCGRVRGDDDRMLDERGAVSLLQESSTQSAPPSSTISVGFVGSALRTTVRLGAKPHPYRGKQVEQSREETLGAAAPMPDDKTALAEDELASLRAAATPEPFELLQEAESGGRRGAARHSFASSIPFAGSKKPYHSCGWATSTATSPPGRVACRPPQCNSYATCEMKCRHHPLCKGFMFSKAAPGGVQCWINTNAGSDIPGLKFVTTEAQAKDKNGWAWSVNNRSPACAAHMKRDKQDKAQPPGNMLNKKGEIKTEPPKFRSCGWARVSSKLATKGCKKTVCQDAKACENMCKKQRGCGGFMYNAASFTQKSFRSPYKCFIQTKKGSLGRMEFVKDLREARNQHGWAWQVNERDASCKQKLFARNLRKVYDSCKLPGEKPVPLVVGKTRREIKLPGDAKLPGATSKQISVRCCQAGATTLVGGGMESRKCISKVNGTCLGVGKSFEDAKAICKNLSTKRFAKGSYDLCTEKDLNSNACCDSGCGANATYTWLSDREPIAGKVTGSCSHKPIEIGVRVDRNKVWTKGPPKGARDTGIVAMCCRGNSTQPECVSGENAQNGNGTKCFERQRTYEEAVSDCSRLGQAWGLCTRKQLASGACCSTKCNKFQYTWLPSNSDSKKKELFLKMITKRKEKDKKVMIARELKQKAWEKKNPIKAKVEAEKEDVISTYEQNQKWKESKAEAAWLKKQKSLQKAIWEYTKYHDKTCSGTSIDMEKMIATPDECAKACTGGSIEHCSGFSFENVEGAGNRGNCYFKTGKITAVKGEVNLVNECYKKMSVCSLPCYDDKMYSVIDPKNHTAVVDPLKMKQGEERRLICAHGYFPLGSRVNYETYTCRPHKRDGVVRLHHTGRQTLRCVPKFCGLPKLEMPHQIYLKNDIPVVDYATSASIANQIRMQPGSVVTIACANGYVPERAGEPSLCDSKGFFTPQLNPTKVKCVPKLKGTPDTCIGQLKKTCKTLVGKPPLQILAKAAADLAAKKQTCFNAPQQPARSTVRTNFHFAASSSDDELAACTKYQLDAKGAWCFKQGSGLFHVMQADLERTATVMGVVTQGMAQEGRWVTKYIVSTSIDGENWTESVPCPGNTDDSGRSYAMLSKKVRARFVRMHISAWEGAPAMRLAVVVDQPYKAPVVKHYDPLMGGFKIRRGHKLKGSLTTSQEFNLEFQIYPTARDREGWQNIMHLTTGGDNCEDHQRIPAIFFHPRSTRLRIRMSHIDSCNAGCDPPDQLPLNQWSNVTVKLESFLLEVKVNGKTVCSNSGYSLKVSVAKHVQVWIADELNPAAAGILRNVKYTPTGKRNVPQPYLFTADAVTSMNATVSDEHNIYNPVDYNINVPVPDSEVLISENEGKFKTNEHIPTTKTFNPDAPRNLNVTFDKVCRDTCEVPLPRGPHQILYKRGPLDSNFVAVLPVGYNKVNRGDTVAVGCAEGYTTIFGPESVCKGGDGPGHLQPALNFDLSPRCQPQQCTMDCVGPASETVANIANFTNQQWDLLKPRNATDGPCSDVFSGAVQMCRHGPRVKLKGHAEVYCGCSNAYTYVNLVHDTVKIPKFEQDFNLDQCIPFNKKFYNAAAKSFKARAEAYGATWLKSCAARPKEMASYIAEPPKPPFGSVVQLRPYAAVKWNGQGEHASISPQRGAPTKGLAWHAESSELMSNSSKPCPATKNARGMAWCDEWAPWQKQLPMDLRGAHKCGCAKPYLIVERAASMDYKRDFCQETESDKVSQYTDDKVKSWTQFCLKRYVTKESQGPDPLCAAVYPRGLNEEVGESTEDAFAFRVKKAMRENPAPRPPVGFAWTPLPGNLGKTWPQPKRFCNGNCSATFWYGVAHCDRGEQSDMYIPSSHGSPIRVGFGCDDGHRVKVVIKGTSNKFGCAAQFVEWERQMEQVATIATSTQVPQLVEAINSAVFTPTVHTLTPPPSMVQLGDAVHFLVKSMMCSVDVLAMASKCNAPLGAYVPITLTKGAAYKDVYVGCTCESPLHVQAEVKIVWMRDQTQSTQGICADFQAAVNSEVTAALSGAEEEPQRLFPDDQQKLLFLAQTRMFKPRRAAENNCMILDKVGWAKSNVLENHKEVQSKVHHDESLKNVAMGIEYAQKEVRWIANEKENKVLAAEDEVAMKAKAKGATMLRIYNTEQEFKRVQEKESQRKEKAAKKAERKFRNRQLRAQEKVSKAQNKLAKEATTKEAASAERATKEKKVKSEKDKKATAQLVKAQQEAAAKHKKETAEKKREASAKELRRKKTMDAKAAAEAKGAKERKGKEHIAKDAAKEIKSKEAKAARARAIVRARLEVLEHEVGYQDAYNAAKKTIGNYAEKLKDIHKTSAPILGSSNDLEVKELGSTSHSVLQK